MASRRNHAHPNRRVQNGTTGDKRLGANGTSPEGIVSSQTGEFNEGKQNSDERQERNIGGQKHETHISFLVVVASMVFGMVHMRRDGGMEVLLRPSRGGWREWKQWSGGSSCMVCRRVRQRRIRGTLDYTQCYDMMVPEVVAYGLEMPGANPLVCAILRDSWEKQERWKTH